jgi:hypothetical protein
MTPSKDLTVGSFQNKPQDFLSLNRAKLTRQIPESKRTTTAPQNKISTRPSLGSFSSLNNIHAITTKNIAGIQGISALNKNSTWDLTSRIKSEGSANHTLRTSNAVKAISAAQDKYLSVAGQSTRVANKISLSGGITLKEGHSWETSKRPVVTISSGEMRRDNSTTDTQAKKRLKRDRDGNPLQLEKVIKEPRTLQCFFDEMISSLGYSTETFCALDTGYHAKPTKLQKASYGLHLVQAIRASDTSFISKFLKCGVSSNPCNMFGESIVHMVCRRGNFNLLKTFIDGGCSVQVSDDFGRTPLHDACWTSEPCFKSVELVLDKDIRLFNIRDCRGFTPLNYVKRENWSKWIEFFNSKKHIYWSYRDVKKIGDQEPPPLSSVKPNTNPVKDPANAVSIEIASMLASGAMSPDEILQRKISSEMKSKSSHPSSPLICA